MDRLVERWWWIFFFFQAEDGIRDYKVTGVQTCALPICRYVLRDPLPVVVHGAGPGRPGQGDGPIGREVERAVERRLQGEPEARADVRRQSREGDRVHLHELRCRRGRDGCEVPQMRGGFRRLITLASALSPTPTM